jgi:hypothetical protein
MSSIFSTGARRYYNGPTMSAPVMQAALEGFNAAQAQYQAAYRLYRGSPHALPVRQAKANKDLAEAIHQLGQAHLQKANKEALGMPATWDRVLKYEAKVRACQAAVDALQSTVVHPPFAYVVPASPALPTYVAGLPPGYFY